MNRPTCETCPFWAVLSPTAIGGECHKNPPPWLGATSTDFCGAHRHFPAWMAQQEVARFEANARRDSGEGMAAASLARAKPAGHEGKHVWDGGD